MQPWSWPTTGGRPATGRRHWGLPFHAGDAAGALFAMPQAYTYFERALMAGSRIPTDSPGWLAIDRIDLLMKTADAAYLSGEFER